MENWYANAVFKLYFDFSFKLGGNARKLLNKTNIVLMLKINKAFQMNRQVKKQLLH